MTQYTTTDNLLPKGIMIIYGFHCVKQYHMIDLLSGKNVKSKMKSKMKCILFAIFKIFQDMIFCCFILYTPADIFYLNILHELLQRQFLISSKLKIAFDICAREKYLKIWLRENISINLITNLLQGRIYKSEINWGETWGETSDGGLDLGLDLGLVPQRSRSRGSKVSDSVETTLSRPQDLPRKKEAWKKRRMRHSLALSRW